jgi:hypothetical protein
VSSNEAPENHKTALYTIFGTMVAFKLVTALWILWMQPTLHGAAFLAMTNLVWFALIALPVLLGGGFWYRRMRVRRKRKALIHAEWHVDEPVATGSRLSR